MIAVLIDRCLCNPILPPSGVSTGSINPHWVLCNKWGPTILAVGSNGKLVFLKCEICVNQDNRFKSWTNPSLLVFTSAPQLPLNPLLNPSSTIRSLKNGLILSSIKLKKFVLYFPAW